jgi:hypothetical protein
MSSNLQQRYMASIIREMAALMMEAVRTAETSVYFYETTRCHMPEECHDHTRHRDNLKSHDEVGVHVTQVMLHPSCRYAVSLRGALPYVNTLYFFA